MPGQRGAERPDRWALLTVITGIGAFVVLAVWLAGPQLLGAVDDTGSRTVTATVTEGTPCGRPNSTETVRFMMDGRQQEATYSACGHRPGERREVAVPTETAGGKLQVHDADAAAGQGSLRRPASLLLLGLSCVGGGIYAQIMRRPGGATIPRFS